MHDIVFSEEEIAAKVSEIAVEITKDYKDKELVVLSVLTGAFIFTADLVRKIDLPLQIDFIKVSSYKGTESTNRPECKCEHSVNICGKHVIVVEDILDTGYTLSYINEILQKDSPASVSFVALINKPSRRKKAVRLKYPALTVDDSFIVGYGLDCNDEYRNFPNIVKL